MAADGTPTAESRAEFDVDAYAAAALKQGKGLDDLEAELGEQLRSIRQELYSLIDERYEDFLGLSTSLTGIDATIDGVKEPLAQITTEIQTTHTELAAKLEYVDARMAYRSAIREKKQVLRLFIDLSQLLDRVDAVLKEASELDVGSAEFVKCLERAAVDLSQIRYFSNKGAEYPFVAQSAERISRIEDMLLTALDQSLTHYISEYLAAHSSAGSALVISSDDAIVMIAQCLGAYSTVEEHGRAEEVIRQRMVRPFVQDEVLGVCGTRKGMGIDPSTFASILQKILGFVSRLAVPLVQGIELHFPASGYMLESSVFWREIATNLVGSLPLLFVPGMPDHFHRNYLAACRFMREFGAMFAVSKGGSASYADYADGGGPLASEPSYVEFNRKWQLSAYFSIRKKQIIDAVEGRNREQAADMDNKGYMAQSPDLNGKAGGLSRNSRPGTPSSAVSLTSLPGNLGASNDSSSLASSLELDKETIARMQRDLGLHTEHATRAILAIRQCWSPSVYIEPLASRFWQLTVQLMIWYQQTADQHIRQLIRRNAELGGPSALESAEVDQLLHHICDIYELKALILEQARTSSSLIPVTVASMSTGSSSAFRSKVLDGMERLVAQMFRPLEDTAHSAFSYMAATIVSISCSNLASQLRRTTSQFRHTNRSPPSSASSFVGKLFAPLSALETRIDELRSAADSPSLKIGLDSTGDFLTLAKDTLRSQTCEGISREFAKACDEALSSISKTEASLQRLRKSKGGAAAKLDAGADDLPVPVGVDLRGKVPATDNEKIRRQIWLDVAELSRLIGEFESRPHREFIDFVQLIVPLGP
ncbi:hypothetical protein H4R20_000094 [Coemansia guatemalensis]|uniref:Conserved oligomeric Golgi complex subunit 2 n=1 Tax=Coemansia guatemalensis TaxID=2761395 RepID=A0A9W8HZM1_9FUNG|nr:hypothetical protein H4R20_000094 [Coemansia guatemalensis]